MTKTRTTKLIVAAVLAAAMVVLVLIVTSGSKQEAKFRAPGHALNSIIHNVQTTVDSASKHTLSCHTADGHVWYGTPCAAH